MSATETNREFYFRVVNPKIKLLIKIYKRTNDQSFFASLKNALHYRKIGFAYGFLIDENFTKPKKRGAVTN